MSDVTTDINALLLAQLPAGAPLQIPPPCLIDMQGEPMEYVEGQSLAMRFPVLARYQNPIGYMQGGFIVAALDNTLGPFSYLIAPPSVTTSINTQYLRPVTPDLTHIICHAKLVERTRNQLFLAGEIRDDAGRVLVMCQAVCQILPQKAG